MYYAKPNIKVDIGGGTLTLEGEGVISLQSEYGIDGEFGLAKLRITNPDGKYTSSINNYDEVKIYAWYDDQSQTQIYGGHLEKIGYGKSSGGDDISITVIPYEFAFTFKNINHSYEYDYIETIASTSSPGIVYGVNTNLSVADDFTTNYSATVGNVQTTDADLDRSVPIWSVYDAATPHTVGQTFRPVNPYTANVVVKVGWFGAVSYDLECRLYEWDTDWDTTVAGTLLGYGTISYIDDMNPVIYAMQASDNDDSANIADEVDDQVNIEYVGQTFTCVSGKIRNVWVKVKKGGGSSQDLKCSLFKCKDGAGAYDFTDTLVNVDWDETCAGVLTASDTIADADLSTSYEWKKFSLNVMGLKQGGLYLIAFGNSAAYTDGDWFLRIYTPQDNYGAGELFEDGAPIDHNDLLFYVEEYDFTEKGIPLRADNLDTTKDHLLVFSSVSNGSDNDGYMLQVDTDPSYAGGQLYEDETAVAGRDLWFKINTIAARFEDTDGFDAMTDIWSRVNHDWYANYSKQIQTVHRTSGASVATFTIGALPVIGGNLTRNTQKLKNKIKISGREKTIYEPKNRDEWTESDNDLAGSSGPNWKRWTVSSVDVSMGFTDTDLAIVGSTALWIDRILAGSVQTEYSIYFPGSGAGNGTFPDYYIDNKFHTLAFWVCAVNTQDQIDPLSFRLGINITTKDTATGSLYRTVTIPSVPSSVNPADYRNYWIYISVPLPKAGKPNGWGTLFGLRSPWSQYDLDFVKYLKFTLLDRDFTDYTQIGILVLDGLHFIGEQSHSVTLNDTTSQATYDTRETVKRDRNLDTTTDTSSLAQATLEHLGDGSHVWADTPGDTRDIQQEGDLLVVGRNDIKPTDKITVVNSNAGISQDYRVTKVRHNITKQGGWTTAFDLHKLNKAESVGQILARLSKSQNRAQQAGNVDHGRASQNISGWTGPHI